MKCTKPILATPYVKGNGKTAYRPVKLVHGCPPDGLELSLLPDNKCMSCRINYARDWAVRGWCELQLFPQAFFLTLTQDDEHLDSPSCRKKDIQKFFDLARYYLGTFRYIACQEYGDKFGRPHYHMIMYWEGHEFNYYRVQIMLEAREQGQDLMNLRRGFMSQTLKDIWKRGNVRVDPCTFETIQYVAKYMTKKIKGKDAWKSYTIEETGEVVETERLLSSRNPAVGLRYVTQYAEQLYEHPYIVISNKKYPLPRYFLKKLEEINPEKYVKMREKQREEETWATEQDLDNSEQIRLYLIELKKQYEINKLMKGV